MVQNPILRKKLETVLNNITKLSGDIKILLDLTTDCLKEIDKIN